MIANRSDSYLAIIKKNRSFRYLWYGQVVSELGDWLNSIAIYTLILEVSNSSMALAGVMMAKLLPIVVISPIAGVVIDRFDRKWVMIASDLGRFVIVLGFLTVDGPEDIVIVFILTLLSTALTGFFEPARSAIIPSLIPRKNLVAANALSGSTWSVMLAFGAAMGGLIVSIAGIRTAFIIDAFTFLLSAFLLFNLPSNAPGLKKDELANGWSNLRDGLRYLLAEPVILVLTLLKSGLALAGGIMTLIPLYANQLYSKPEKISLAIGILYSARGLGAAIGPPLARKIFGDSPKALQVCIGASFILGAVCYYLFALSANLWSASLALGLATLFGSIVWVYSTALIHLEAPNHYLGRIFSVELGLLTLIMGLSNWAVGIGIDQFAMSVSTTAMWIAGIIAIPGFLWGGFIWLLQHRKG
ncbi:MAG: MFS transporter [Nitrospinae bacterium CG11_big_fil_rev_8_21_14_0_20_45_15]|nr:MAG: MFS transporter [Nitrospinae bacterium CG11_big_fil_rev_8_21_14_0_20_45_15]